MKARITMYSIARKTIVELTQDAAVYAVCHGVAAEITPRDGGFSIMLKNDAGAVADFWADEIDFNTMEA